MSNARKSKVKCPECGGEFPVVSTISRDAGRRYHVCSDCGQNGYTTDWVIDATFDIKRSEAQREARYLAQGRSVPTEAEIVAERAAARERRLVRKHRHTEERRSRGPICDITQHMNRAIRLAVERGLEFCRIERKAKVKVPVIKKPRNTRDAAIAKDVAVVKAKAPTLAKVQTSIEVKIRNRVEDILLARALGVPIESLL